ncbi:hypothetical protein GF312_15655 [Candidatus Poribacteria bacterium]|nr:hypothetical protein [Candidatus Poribacteria bacterium]
MKKYKGFAEDKNNSIESKRINRQDQDYSNNIKNISESETRLLMLRMEELAKLEGIRDNIQPSTRRLIDNKASKSEVLRHDGTIGLSGDWDAGINRSITVGKLKLKDSNTYITTDESGNMTLTDKDSGTHTLDDLLDGSGGTSISHVFIKAINQPAGDLHLSDPANWNVSKAIIKIIRVVNQSTDWDLYLLQNGNGHTVNDANIPEIQIMQSGNGDANIYLDIPYQDEDGSNQVHLYYADNSGSNTADIYIIGCEIG